MVKCPKCGKDNTGVYEKDGYFYFNKCDCPVPGEPVVRKERATEPVGNWGNPSANWTRTI